VGNVVDNAHYIRGSEAVRRCESRERERLGLPDRFFLTVSRLSPEKNLDGLLRAFAQYRKQGGTWDLVVVGSGPLEGELKERVDTGAVSGVHFVGWQSYEDLPRYYGLASCFVLPSISETWGLVVNEAMACGLPVLVSERCGCAPELCRPGENGFTFAPNATGQLAQFMLEVSSSRKDQLAAWGKASQRIVSAFTPQAWAESLRDCITAVVEKRK